MIEFLFSSFTEHDSDQESFTVSEKDLLDPEWLKSIKNQGKRPGPWSSDDEACPKKTAHTNRLVNNSSSTDDEVGPKKTTLTNGHINCSSSSLNGK